MSHLSAERLAALVEEVPTPAEVAHLAGCAECARERRAYQSLAVLAASGTADIGAPLTTWDALAPALTRDGIIDGPAQSEPAAKASPAGRQVGRRPWLQAAAAVALLAGGAAAGRMTAGASALPSLKGPVASNATRAGIDSTSAPRFRSVEEARNAQAQSQVLYQTATAYLAQVDTTSRTAESPSSMRTRLAALDRVREVMTQALNQAPYDPVINGYYLTTAGQREAALRQLNTALPVGSRLATY